MNGVTPREEISGEKKLPDDFLPPDSGCYGVTPLQPPRSPLFFPPDFLARTVTRCRVRLILGPPGCGKTHRLLELLEGELGDVQPEEVAFVAFTRAAREEAKGRVRERFNVTAKRLPWLRTIHSTAFALLQLERGRILCDERWEEFAARYGYRLSGVRADWESGAPGGRVVGGDLEDDCLVRAYEWGRNRQLGVEEALAAAPRAGVSPADLRLFVERLEAFIAEHGLIDFPGMLEEVLRRRLRPPVRVAFVDEAQDLSPLQIAVVRSWFAPCERVYIAGDDDQTVYGFQAADPGWLVGIAEQAEAERRKRQHHAPSTVVEPRMQSHRVPVAVHAVAQAIIRSNRDRVAKTYEPKDAPGEVLELDRREALRLVDGSRSTFVLFRNRYLISSAAKVLLEHDVPFVVEGWGGNAPLSKRGIVLAVRLGLRLNAGVETHFHASHLRALFSMLPKRSRLVPDRAREAVKDYQGLLTRIELVDDLGLGPLLDALRQKGPVAPLTRIRKPDRRYLEALLVRYGELPEPKVTLTTIHGSKGREADLVLLYGDMSRTTFRDYIGSQAGQEAESRVFYVGATRAKETLVLVRPQGRRSFKFPRVGHGGLE